MKIKSYFAKSVETAILEARRELGNDAMLVTSRRSAPESRHLGDYEVVFGLVPEAGNVETAQRPAQDLATDLSALRSQLDDIGRQLAGKIPAPPAAPEITNIHSTLIASDMAPELAREFLDAAEQGWLATPQPRRDDGLLAAIVTNRIRERILTAGELGSSLAGPNRIIIFAGPAGAGKTTQLLKLAARKSLDERRSVRIISVDTHRVGGHERLRVYAGIIGIGFTAANTIGELKDALDEFRTKEFIFIDTPGYSSADEESATELSQFLRSIPNREVHLVLPASLKRADLARAAARFEIFSPDALIFTRLDETDSLGGIISEAIRSAKPMSYLSTGPGVLEHLELAKPETLAAALLSKTLERSAFAA